MQAPPRRRLGAERSPAECNHGVGQAEVTCNKLYFAKATQSTQFTTNNQKLKNSAVHHTVVDGRILPPR